MHLVQALLEPIVMLTSFQATWSTLEFSYGCGCRIKKEVSANDYKYSRHDV